MMSPQDLQQHLAHGETVTCEFKSDRKQLSDSVIYEEVVALANADGGVLLIGVEDDGTVTGAAPSSRRCFRPSARCRRRSSRKPPRWRRGAAWR